jgi:AcrR family transcriptional regulator
VTSTNIARRRESAQAESGPAYAARREEIIRAAGQAFLAKGYQAASFKDIAELLGLDRATLYYYFSSKQELFQTATSSAVERNARAAEHLAASDATASEKVSELFRRVLDSYTNLDYPYMFVFLEEDVGRIAKGAEGRRWARSVRTLSDRFQDAVTRIFEQGIRAGEFETDVPAPVLTQAVIGMLDGTRRWYRPGDSLSADEIARHFTRTLVRGIGRRS